MNSGTYLLILKLEEDLDITRPYRIRLKKGYYVYVGSAMNSLTGRLRRHLSKKKKIHWHIDQLTERGKVVLIVALIGRKVEREISEFLSRHMKVIERFGSSDLKVKGNLFLIENPRDMFDILRNFSDEGYLV